MEHEAKFRHLMESLLTTSLKESWERAFVEIYVATYELSAKFQYTYVDLNKELRSLKVDSQLGDELFDFLIEWCSICLQEKGKRWNRIHVDFVPQSLTMYYYWDQWYYDDLYHRR